MLLKPFPAVLIIGGTLLLSSASCKKREEVPSYVVSDTTASFAESQRRDDEQMKDLIFKKGVPQDLAFRKEAEASDIYEQKLRSLRKDPKWDQLSREERVQRVRALKEEDWLARQRMRKSLYKDSYSPRW